MLVIGWGLRYDWEFINVLCLYFFWLYYTIKSCTWSAWELPAIADPQICWLSHINLNVGFGYLSISNCRKYKFMLLAGNMVFQSQLIELIGWRRWQRLTHWVPFAFYFNRNPICFSFTYLPPAIYSSYEQMCLLCELYFKKIHYLHLIKKKFIKKYQ